MSFGSSRSAVDFRDGGEQSDLMGSSPASNLPVFDIDAELEKVYDDCLLNGPGVERADLWFGRWQKAVRLAPRRYDLPGGAVGRRFVDLLMREVGLVADLKEQSERLIVFQAVVLQKEPLMKKSADVRRLLTRRMDLWEGDEFEILMSEAIRGNKSFQRSRWRGDAAWQKREHEHSVNVFHRLMIQGKLRAAVRWLTERDSAGLLSPSKMTKVKTSSGEEIDVSALDA